MNIKEIVTITVFILLTLDSISTYLCRKRGMTESNKRMKSIFTFFENIFKVESGGEFIANTITRIFFAGVLLWLHFSMESNFGYVIAVIISSSYLIYAIVNNLTLLFKRG